MKFIAKCNILFDHIISAFAYVAAVVLVSTMLIVGADVIVRTLGEGGRIFWAVEVSEYCLLFITFLASAWLLKEDGHVKMDIVLSRLTPKTQALLNSIISIIGAIICLILVWYGIESTWDHFQLNYMVYGLLRIPKWTLLLIIPIGSALLFIQFFRRSYGYFGTWRALKVSDE